MKAESNDIIIHLPWSSAEAKIIDIDKNWNSAAKTKNNAWLLLLKQRVTSKTPDTLAMTTRVQSGTEKCVSCKRL
jgi:hypothetical protein